MHTWTPHTSRGSLLCDLDARHPGHSGNALSEDMVGTRGGLPAVHAEVRLIDAQAGQRDTVANLGYMRVSTSGMVSAGADLGGQVIAGAQGALESASPSKVFERIGGDVTAGLSGGIDSTSSSMNASAAAMAQGSIDAVNSTLDSASPSRELERCGRFFGEGFWLGIESEHRHCQDAARQAAQGATTAVAEEVYNAIPVGEMWGIDLATGMRKSLGLVATTGQQLAQAATAGAQAELGRMGLLGIAGGGAGMIGTGGVGATVAATVSQAVSQSVSQAVQQAGGSQSQPCIHIHLDGREVNHMIQKVVTENLDHLGRSLSGQKR